MCRLHNRGAHVLCIKKSRSVPCSGKAPLGLLYKREVRAVSRGYCIRLHPSTHLMNMRRICANSAQNLRKLCAVSMFTKLPSLCCFTQMWEPKLALVVLIVAVVLHSNVS